MAFLNVNRGVQDPYYRYKMPRIYAKVEGKGNGIKTVIVNMTEVAKALARPPTYPTKYFGCELGAQTNFDLKNDRYIVNGEHDANKLQDILDGFIRKFVLCPACENPETTLLVRRNVIHSKCKACGHAFTIDSKHKIATFILKNPPPVEPTVDTKERPEGGSPTEEFTLNGGSIETNGKAGSAEDEDEDDDWAPEPLTDQEKLSAQVGKLVIDNDLEKPIEERLDMLHQYFLKAKQEDNLGDGKNLLNEAERLEIKSKAALLLVDVLLTKEVVKELKNYRTLFLRFCLNDKRAQRYFLGGIEQLIQSNPELLPRAPHILKALYDNDLCEEEAILAWSEKPSSKYVKKELAREIIKLCEPFITWLKEAEEETESEDEDMAVSFDDRSRVIGTVVEKKVTANSNGVGKDTVIKTENGEEVDIENI